MQNPEEVKPEQACISGAVALRMRYTKYSNHLMTNLLYFVVILEKVKITAFIPYTLNKNEKADGLYAVYVDKKGKVRKIKGSYYDGENSAVVFIVGRLADFGIGYKKESK